MLVNMPEEDGNENETKLRTISITSLNYTVVIKSEHEDDTLREMKELAFEILNELKRCGY